MYTCRGVPNQAPLWEYDVNPCRTALGALLASQTQFSCGGSAVSFCQSIMRVEYHEPTTAHSNVPYIFSLGFLVLARDFLKGFSEI